MIDQTISDPSQDGPHGLEVAHGLEVMVGPECIVESAGLIRPGRLALFRPGRLALFRPGIFRLEELGGSETFLRSRGNLTVVSSV
ncbi:hypothetical protein [Arthrobacter echini]|uniref:hypothetical protein n=1 Tax=Arthrobacter echini TaxID=1529066 RepID=UPI0014561773|nr:hypothetical protein [Arthrobacter echini]